MDEIRRTKNQQQLEHEKRKAVYQLLKEISRRQITTTTTTNNNNNTLECCFHSLDYDKLDYDNQFDTEHFGDIDAQQHHELLRRAQTVIDSYGGGGRHGHRNKEVANRERESLLKRLDRMIRLMQKESQNKLSSKSCHDIFERNELPLKKPYSSTTELSKTSPRPKSSYGRGRSIKYADTCSQPNLEHTQQQQDQQDNRLLKSKSTNNLVDEEAEEEENEIESLEGESFNGSDDQVEVDNSTPRSQMSYSRNNKHRVGKAYDVNSYGRQQQQQVRVTLRFDSLNGGNVLSRRAKRSVRIFQQIVPGGNSIMLFDRFVTPGELFTVAVRAHPRNSFAIVSFVDGIRDMQINTCCEHKHKRGTRLSQFTLVDVVGSRPCLGCHSGGQSVEHLAVTTEVHPTLVDRNKTRRPRPRLNIQKASSWGRVFPEQWNEVEETRIGQDVDEQETLKNRKKKENSLADEVDDDLDDGAVEKTSQKDKLAEQGHDTVATSGSTNDINKIIDDTIPTTDDRKRSEDDDTEFINSAQQSEPQQQAVAYEHDEDDDNLQEFIALEKQLQAEEEEAEEQRQETSSLSSASETVATVKLNETTSAVEPTTSDKENVVRESSKSKELVKSESMSTETSEFESIVDETMPLEIQQIDSD